MFLTFFLMNILLFTRPPRFKAYKTVNPDIRYSVLVHKTLTKGKAEDNLRPNPGILSPLPLPDNRPQRFIALIKPTTHADKKYVHCIICWGKSVQATPMWRGILILLTLLLSDVFNMFYRTASFQFVRRSIFEATHSRNYLWLYEPYITLLKEDVHLTNARLRCWRDSVRKYAKFTRCNSQIKVK